MRYSIRLAALLRCSEALERAAREECREIEEVRGVIGRLGGLWGMSGIISGLRKDVQDMEEQVQITLAMAQAARRIHQIYTDMERSVTDAADCPFRLDLDPGHSGCGAPVFPSGADTGPAPAETGDAGSGSGTDAVRQRNLQLLDLIEKYLRALFGSKAAALAVERLRQQLQL